jgi:hypothetical protein
MLKPRLWALIDKYSRATTDYYNLNQQEFAPNDERESLQKQLSDLENDINNLLYKMKYKPTKTQLILTVLACINCLFLVYWGMYSGDLGLTGISGLYPPLIYLINK